ncbi:aldose epimerase family protein [Echinicola jeungdonensis]|uniref:Aldose 1-epimerase n=1 Tax=Echinicola jeungdonensis TaxID=709343 RepID=A0ABV5J6E2_9BACT|nr:aldose epimerase family protein [Echinicola jeungdonensis]MDN3668716.1 aldose epimerase family protein [Echinicola jeungdonensis]
MSASNQTQSAIKIEETVFGKNKDGQEIQLYTIISPKGHKACVTNYGATLTHLFVINKEGQLQDVVLGFDSFEGYQSEAYFQSGAFMGSTVGRVCNRIEGGTFTLEGKTIQLDNSHQGNHLHGGKEGYDKKIWKAEIVENGLKLRYLSPDGEENYPGNLEVEIFFGFCDGDEFTIHYKAKTDKTTVVNLTNHAYFNLGGDFSKSILDHDLQVNAPFYVPVKEKSIPTGEILSVKNSPYDFLEPKKIRECVFADHPQVKIGNGLDQTLVLDQKKPNIKLSNAQSGIEMEVSTSEPGVQFYTANYFDGSLKGKNGSTYHQHAGIAIETQHFPDSPNKAHFPSVVLKPGEEFDSFTKFKFSINK